ncbi:MAG: TatD family hydrolase [Candidatus Micrarchaeota archaeon]
MVIVDSHAHVFDLKREYVIPPDIYPVVVGYSHGSNVKAAEAAKKGGYPFALGIAPQTALKEGTARLGEWTEFIRSCRPNAIGEVGLDYKWATTKEHVESERLVFSKMIGLAGEMGLPLVIHSRNNPLENEVPKDAIEDILAMTEGMRILMHFYSGSEEQAVRIVARGGYISVSHMRSKERRKVINSVPLDRLLVESDSPYVGRTPETTREAVAYIAEAKGLDAEAVANATAENAMRFFGFRI